MEMISSAKRHKAKHGGMIHVGPYKKLNLSRIKWLEKTRTYSYRSKNGARSTRVKVLTSLDFREMSGVSLWSRVRELEGDALRQIQSLYDTNFPIEFRHYFAEIIERQPWDQIEPDQERGLARAFLNIKS